MNRAEGVTEYLLSGNDIVGHLDALASLRLDIFQEFPYLYSGRREHELAYLAGYAEKPGACVIFAEADGVIIGAATGMPLRFEGESLSTPFVETPYPLDHIYYIGELMFRQGYRNLGLGQRLLAQMENHIRSLGRFDKIVCATVERPDDHPLRPGNHVPITRFLDRAGFALLSGITTNFTWREVDGVKRDHTMQFWIKNCPS